MNLPPSRKNDPQSSNSFRYFLKNSSGVVKDGCDNGDDKAVRKQKGGNKGTTPEEAGKDVETQRDCSHATEKLLRFKKGKEESDRQFLDRVDVETNRMLVCAQKKAQKTSDRRKRYITEF